MLIIGLISLLIAVPLFSNLITPSLNSRITSIVLIYAALLSFNGIYIQSIGAGVGLYSGLFQTNVITTGIEGFLLLLGAIILLSWDNNSIKSDSGSLTINEYSLIVLFTAIGSTFLISSYDLISMYLSIELQSFGLYILATLYRKSESATAAGLKYFLLGGLSSAIILLGTALIYSYTGITQFESLYSIVLISGLDSYVQPLILGFILITIGILFKVGASPFHNWAPDVYDGVPTVVTTWLTVIPKVSIFVFLVLLLTGLQGSFESFSVTIIDSSINVWKNVLLISSLLSLVIGTVLGLSQYRIKRLLAFSTISHVGFMLLALSVNSIESIEAFLFYIITYSITNLNAFLILLAFGYIIKAYNTQSKDVQFIHELKGQFNYNNVLSLSLALCLFSIAGVPPLVGFFAKQIVLYSSTHAGYYFISLVAILVSVISASYYLKIIKVLYFDTPEGGTDSPIVNITTLHSTMIAILSLAITFFVLQPNTLLNSCQLLCLSLYYY